MADVTRSRHPFLDFIQTAFVLTDLHGRILYTNRHIEPLFGYAREEIEGQKIRIFFFPEDLKYFLPNILYLAIDKAGFEGDGLLKHKDGKGVFVRLSSSSFKEGEEAFLVFSFQEIQRLKRLERERLELKHRATLGMMVEEIAHQIRNPISSIGGYVRRLMKSPVLLLKTGLYLDRILKETKRLEEKIGRMEELIKMPKPVFRQERFLAIVEKALQRFSQEEKAKGVMLSLEEGAVEGEESFYVDKDLIIRAISHLIENSIDSVKQGRRTGNRQKIRICLSCRAESVEVSVSDRGEGISKKNLEHIFEPFFSTRPERVGLGLTFVKRVVEEHGGRIEVDSRLRVGTTMTLIFPKDRRRPIRREWISPVVQNHLSSL